MKLKIKEIFYSIQGEGARSGQPSVFIRLAMCNLNCWFCDTDWSKGEFMSIDEIIQEIKKFPTEWIIWTGGEPTLQLNDGIIAQFKTAGYKQSIESNGLIPIPEGIDWKVISPKVDFKKIKLNNPKCDEVRLPVHDARSIPDQSELPEASDYYLSPVFLGEEKKRLEFDPQVTEHLVKYCLSNPTWKISIQIHKLLNID